ncbi:MAG TPA: hypothetical protein VIM63_13050 [Rhodoferax sp.]
MRLTANSLFKVLVSAAMLTGLGALAVTTVETTRAQTAPKQDFVTLLAMADLNKQGITRPTKAQLVAEVKSIQAQRASGMGWGAIADSLGLKLGAVVSAANRNMHADDDKRAETTENSKGAENSKGTENSHSSETHGSKGSGSNGGGSGGGSNGGGHGGGKK